MFGAVYLVGGTGALVGVLGLILFAAYLVAASLPGEPFLARGCASV